MRFCETNKTRLYWNLAGVVAALLGAGVATGTDGGAYSMGSDHLPGPLLPLSANYAYSMTLNQWLYLPDGPPADTAGRWARVLGQPESSAVVWLDQSWAYISATRSWAFVPPQESGDEGSWAWFFEVPKRSELRWEHHYSTIVAHNRNFQNRPADIGSPDVTRPGWFSGRYGAWEQDVQQLMGRADNWWRNSGSNGYKRFVYLGEVELQKTLVFYEKIGSPGQDPAPDYQKPFTLGLQNAVLEGVRRPFSPRRFAARWISLQDWFTNPDWSPYIQPHELFGDNFVFTRPDGSVLDPHDTGFRQALARQSIQGEWGASYTTNATISDDEAVLMGLSSGDPEVENVSFKHNGQWVIRQESNRFDFGNPIVIDLLLTDIDYMLWRLTATHELGFDQPRGIEGIHLDGLSRAVSLFRPDQYSFGDWSRHGFKRFLEENYSASELDDMEIQDVSDFDIRTFVQTRGRPISSSDWNRDPVWQVFKIYYVQMMRERMATLRNGIDNMLSAGSYNLETVISGNLIPIWPGVPLYRGLLDVPYFEWVPENGFGLYRLDRGLPSLGGRLGYIGRLAAKVSSVNYSWISLGVTDPNPAVPKAITSEGMHRLLAFSSFTNRMIGDWEYTMAHNRVSPGTADSFRDITLFIKAMRDLWLDRNVLISLREFVADVGIVYDPWSQVATTTVNDHFSGAFTMEYSGWCDFLEDHHIQWDVILNEAGLRLEALTPHQLVILPAVAVLSDESAAVLQQYLDAGGYVIATGDTGERYGLEGNLMPREVGVLDGWDHPNLYHITTTPGFRYRNLNKRAGDLEAMQQALEAVVLQPSLVIDEPSTLNAGVNLAHLSTGNRPVLTVDIVNWEGESDATTFTPTPTPPIAMRIQLPPDMRGFEHFSVSHMQAWKSGEPELLPLPASDYAGGAQVLRVGDELRIEAPPTVDFQVLFIEGNAE